MDNTSPEFTAMSKLTMAAKLYDRRNPNSLPMDEFDVACMSINEFQNSLKKIFNMRLSAEELSILSKKFDNGSGQIDCLVFKKAFHKEGMREREKEQQNLKEKQRRHEEKRKKDNEKKEKAVSETQFQVLSSTFTEDDFKSAKEKITEAAWDFAKGHAVSLGGFDSKTIPPHVFKEQLRQVFKVIVTPAELGALLAHYDKTGSGLVNCAEFLLDVFRMGYEERCRRTELWRKIDNEKIDRMKNEQKQFEKKMEEKQTVKIVSFTEEDSQRALAKLTEAATAYDRNSTTAVSLSEFEREYMPLHIFKEQLRRVFNIQFTPAELSALTAHFDKENSGRIVCLDFLIKFFRAGNEERARNNSKRLESQRQKEERDREMWNKRREESTRRAAALVDFNFTEEDFDSALKKFIELCHKLDRRHFGSEDMKAFEIDAMQPNEFRELMKRNLNFMVLPAELGALISLFDAKNTRVVSCSLFTQIFTSTRVKVEEFKGKSNETQLLEDYQKTVKEAYKARLQRLVEGNTDASKKPWRSHGVSASKRVPRGRVFKPRKPYPTSGLQKLKRRLAVAKHTYRLDLSARTKWSGMFGDIAGDEASVAKNAGVATADQAASGQTPEIVAEPHATDGTFVTGCASATTSSLESHLRVASEPPPLKRINPKHAAASTQDYCKEINIYLVSIPSEVFHLHGLMELWLCNNELSAIPTQLATLKSLETLSLKHNNIDVLPEEICDLSNLRRLYLQGNRLSVLPNSLGRLHSLADLDLKGNLLTSLPDTISMLASLQFLDISHNQISSLPIGLAKLKSLVCLRLEGSAVESPPPVLGKMYWVYVFGCPLPTTKLASLPFSDLVQDVREMESFIRHKAHSRSGKKKR